MILGLCYWLHFLNKYLVTVSEFILLLVLKYDFWLGRYLTGWSVALINISCLIRRQFTPWRCPSVNHNEHSSSRRHSWMPSEASYVCVTAECCELCVDDYAETMPWSQSARPFSVIFHIWPPAVGTREEKLSMFPHYSLKVSHFWHYLSLLLV